jgi:ATP-dependent Clp protease ATP-binding subunit ClpA
VFERYTEEARQVVVLSQEEARVLCHNYIGTEHLLLAVLRLPDDSVVGGAVKTLGLRVEDVRARLLELVPHGEAASSGQLPFTPRAKRALEMALREALSRGNNDVGAEHILLGLSRGDADGVAMRLLQQSEVTPDQVREAVGAAAPEPRPAVLKARRRERRVSAPSARIGVDLSAEANRLLMSAGARALDDGRTLITIADIEAALRRHHEADDPPSQEATG